MNYTQKLNNTMQVEGFPEQSSDSNPADQFMHPDSYDIDRVWFFLVGVVGSVVSVLGAVFNVLSLGVWASREMRMSTVRAIAVTSPLQWPSICTGRRVKVILCAVLLWSVFVNVPLMMELDFKWEWDPDNNVSVLFSDGSEYSASSFHTEVYLKFLNPILTSAIPMAVVGITNVVIVWSLRRQQLKARGLGVSVAERKDNRDTGRITSQVLFISLFTLTSRTLRIVMLIVMEYHDTIYNNDCPLYCGSLAALSHLFDILNATVNFFCYCYFGHKFRRCFVQKYGCSQRRGQDTKKIQNDPTTTSNTKASSLQLHFQEKLRNLAASIKKNSN
ncbi:FMRFamide receptor-like [Aplysia californica]|uniref:FMRFamide receptor-like n=1 Tax=Aplysia californica TaxID=6500 RepID=A0ABM0K7H2_APLCA|nr:FMRFamide receptor-like [Aplysia californica]